MGGVYSAGSLEATACDVTMFRVRRRFWRCLGRGLGQGNGRESGGGICIAIPMQLTRWCEGAE